MNATGLAPLGFGAARLMGGLETRSSIRLIEAALTMGVRHFDTAPSYGEGESEKILGEALEGVTEVRVVTKVGIARPGSPGRIGLAHRLYRTFGKPILARAPRLKARLMLTPRTIPLRFPARRVLGRDEIERSMDESCRLLRRTPDILLLHEPDQFVLDDELEGHLTQLVRDGRITAFGAGTGEVMTAERCFGSVWQSHWAGAYHPAAAQQIFHGLIRGSKSHSEARERLSKARLMAPGTVLLVSASSPGQMAKLAVT